MSSTVYPIPHREEGITSRVPEFDQRLRVTVAGACAETAYSVRRGQPTRCYEDNSDSEAVRTILAEIGETTDADAARRAMSQVEARFAEPPVWLSIQRVAEALMETGHVYGGDLPRLS